ncbi:fmp52 [Hyphodiscus hymeniophilus]|uniref:Fmp52 n=1 Tax=Hyphodiscus hymeniophilus TaxID=353542 RepID=A0A9P6SKU2_9HELO|nr:fmp52 [Hyphodiscus hymeniophilus]
MTSTAVVGSTGLVGSQILTTLLALPSIVSIHSITRRDPVSTSHKLHPIVSSDSSSWPGAFSAMTPTPSIFFSALGTTRGAAGGVENQRKIDHDLNLALAQAAKAAGVKVYVLISSSGASAASSMAYPKMKGELEDGVSALGFDHTIILRPGLIVGSREESRPAEAVVRKIAGFAGMLGHGFKDFWAQDAEIIAKAAVAGGLMALEGKVEEKVLILAQSDIVRLGRTEWKA